MWYCFLVVKHLRCGVVLMFSSNPIRWVNRCSHQSCFQLKHWHVKYSQWKQPTEISWNRIWTCHYKCMDIENDTEVKITLFETRNGFKSPFLPRMSRLNRQIDFSKNLIINLWHHFQQIKNWNSKWNYSDTIIKRTTQIRSKKTVFTSTRRWERRIKWTFNGVSHFDAVETVSWTQN